VVRSLRTRSGDGVVPIEAEARRVEEALLVMKQERARLYEALMYRYRDRWMDVTASEAMKCSVPTYRGMVNRGYAWLDGYLCRCDRAA
jgi:hypothetical protein